MSAIDKLPSRACAHPFDRRVRIQGDNDAHGADPSPNAIGGCFGIAWVEAFRCHLTGQIYAVHCSDSVNYGKAAHSDSDLEWMEAMRERIVARTTDQRRGPIVLSSHEWAIMLHFGFYGWLDPLDGEYKTVGDAQRHLDAGVVGTIRGMSVVVDRKVSDNLPPVGDFDFEDEEPTLAAAPRHATTTTRFEGVLAEAFAKAGLRAS